MNTLKMFVLCLIIAFSIPLAAQIEGIQFSDLNWSEALAEAVKEDKLIFVDAYTTWCGPCKRMDKTTFKEKLVGGFYNKHFINLKVDMEKGEGLDIADKYQVIVYPTLLFIDGNANVVHRSAGFHTTDQFIDLGQQAVDPSRQLAGLNMRFAKGDRDPDFLKTYAAARFEVQDGSHQRIAETFLETQNNWNTQDCKDIIYTYISDTDTPMFDYLISNKSAFIDDYGQANVQDKIDRLVNDALLSDKKMAAPAAARALFERVNPLKADMLSAQYEMQYHRKRGDRENFAKAAVIYVSNNQELDWKELNEIAWTFNLVIEDKAMLNQAVKWTRSSIKMDSNFYNHETLAALYYKLKKKGKAKKAANKAISYAMMNAIDSTETEKLLLQIQAL